jgi:hypothetical protein
VARSQQSRRAVYDVTYSSRAGQWTAKQAGTVIAHGQTKDDVVRQTIAQAKRQVQSSVRIHKRDGKVQEERTYPRSSDPRGTRG